MDDHAAAPTNPPPDVGDDASGAVPSQADSELADMVRSIHAIGEDVTAGESDRDHE